MTSKQWDYAKWFANVCFLVATVSMLSPVTAATAIFPWAAYLVGNVVWLADSAVHKNWPWVWLAAFFSVWDVLLIISRLYGLEFFVILDPLVKTLEMLP